jgi:hypothetical protein
MSTHVSSSPCTGAVILTLLIFAQGGCVLLFEPRAVSEQRDAAPDQRPDSAVPTDATPPADRQALDRWLADGPPPPDGRPPPPEDSALAPPDQNTCSCNVNPPSGANPSFCHHLPETPGCPMTYPGGYCDPNGDGSYDDADWEMGHNDWLAKCGP